MASIDTDNTEQRLMWTEEARLEADRAEGATERARRLAERSYQLRCSWNEKLGL